MTQHSHHAIFNFQTNLFVSLIYLPELCNSNGHSMGTYKYIFKDIVLRIYVSFLWSILMIMLEKSPKSLVP